MSIPLDLLATLAGLAIGLATFLVLLLQYLRTHRNTRYDGERHRVQLEEVRRAIETQTYRLQERLVATENRWRDVNHLLISSQSSQTDSDGDQRPILSRFLRSAGLRNDDLAVDPKLVFVLIPFNPQYEGVYQLVSSICSEIGLKAQRGDEEFLSGDIFPHIIRLLVRARIVVADVDGRNPNVFYELGIAQAIGKNTILIAKAPQDVPFDLKAKRLVIYEDEAQLRQRLSLELSRALAASSESPVTNLDPSPDFDKGISIIGTSLDRTAVGRVEKARKLASEVAAVARDVTSGRATFHSASDRQRLMAELTLFVSQVFSFRIYGEFRRITESSSIDESESHASQQQRFERVAAYFETLSKHLTNEEITEAQTLPSSFADFIGPEWFINHPQG